MAIVIIAEAPLLTFELSSSDEEETDDLKILAVLREIRAQGLTVVVKDRAVIYVNANE